MEGIVKKYTLRLLFVVLTLLDKVTDSLEVFAYEMMPPKADKPIKPTVKCKCGWKGVGVNLVVHADGKRYEKETCPNCKSEKHISNV
jgi:hypothetical protein